MSVLRIMNMRPISKDSIVKLSYHEILTLSNNFECFGKYEFWDPWIILI